MGHPKYLTDYDTFYDRLFEKFDAMSEVAYDKLLLEQTLHIDFPWSGDKPNGEPIEDAKDKLNNFAVYECYGDYDALESIKTCLEAARTFLNGATIPDSVPEEHRDLFPKGIDPELTAIATGLASWDYSAGDVFREHYVSTIGSRKTNQVSSIDVSIETIISAQRFLIEARKSALGFPDHAKSQLDGYNPLVPFGLDAMDAAFTGIGIFTGPVGSTLVVVTQKALPKSDGHNVGTLMAAMESAIQSTIDAKTSGEETIAGRLDTKLTEEGDSWDSRVCSRPAP